MFYCNYGKRIIDILLSLIGLILFSPFFILVSILIKIDSKGPIIFTQTRVGKEGKLFKIYKFRTMCVNAEQIRSHLQNKNDMENVLFKIKDDPRITFVGKYLRKTSIDELPQLWNVVKGEMSLVGPRPALPEEILKYSTKDLQRLKVKPGCSGLWQIMGRNDLSFESMIRLDLEYINNIKFKNDILIIYKTFGVMRTGKGAY